MGTQPAPATRQTTILPTVEEMKARIKQAEEAKDLDAAVKTKLIDLYKQTIVHLNQAKEHAEEAAGFEKDAAEAPARLKKIEEELKKRPPQAKPEMPPEATLAQLQQRLAKAEAELGAAKKASRDVVLQRKHRSDRQRKIPEEAADAKKRLDEIMEQLGKGPTAQEAASVSSAKRTMLLAKKKAVEQEIVRHRKELLCYEATGELLAAQADRMARQVAHAEKSVKAWQETVNQYRREEAARQARAARKEAEKTVHPTVRRIAKENAQLAERRTGPEGLAAKIEQIAYYQKDLREKLDTLKEDFKNVKEKAETPGLVDLMGVFLRKKRAELPRIRDYQPRLRSRQSEMAKAQLDRLELAEKRSKLSDIDARIKKVAASPDSSIGPSERAQIEADLRNVLEKQRAYLQSLIDDYDTYIYTAMDVSVLERHLITQVQTYESYIAERVLWIRSTRVFGPSEVVAAWPALTWLANPKGWTRVIQALSKDTWDNPFTVGLALAILLALLISRRRLRSQLEAIAKLVPPSRTDRFSHTLKALAITLLMAILWPGLIGLIAWRLAQRTDTPGFVSAVATGLGTAAVFYLMLEILRQIVRPIGLAERHFRWRSVALDPVRKNLGWLTGIGLPLVFVASAMEAHGHDAWNNSLGRSAFIVGLVVLSGFVQRILRPSGELMRAIIGRKRGGWLDRLRYVWYPLAVLAPIALATVALLGYYYTALELEERLRLTFVLATGLAIVDAIFMRCFFVVRRRLAMRKARQRETATRTEPQEPGVKIDAEGTPVVVDEPTLNLFTMSTQTRKLLQAVMAFAMIIGLWFIWVDVLPALAILDKTELWSTGEDGVAISLADLSLAGFIVVMTVIAARNIPGMLEMTILQRLPLEAGNRYAITALSRYLIITIGIIVAFGEIGIGWSKVQWLVAAVGVGLGFGLQEIFANFVSGLIILFERPIRVGDTVTVGDISGTVSRIRIRATTITDWNRKELIVPNKVFITGQLINWTLSDSIIRVVIPVGIAYGSDTALANQLLMRVAHGNPDVLKDPKPYALFLGFGESSLNFELRVYIPSLDCYIRVWHDSHMAIDAAFREANIEIAFPQQDVHIRSISQPLPLAQAGERR